MANSTIKIFNDVSKKGYANIDFVDQKSLFYQFQRYAVRRSIADRNTTLSSIFKSHGDFSACFNFFNSAFIGNYYMLDLLNDGELDNIPYMSNASFEALLDNAKFERQIALICYSLRNNERIPNRVDYPVLIAYANMQDRVLNYYKKGKDIFAAIKVAGEETREEFMRKNGCSMEYELKSLPDGTKIKVDRNVTEKIGYSGTLTAGQQKAYGALISSVVDDLFAENKDEKQVSQVMQVLINKVLKSHVNDPEFDSNQLAFEVIYRYFMPTNELKREFLDKTRNLEQRVANKVQAKIDKAQEVYNTNSNYTTMKNLEKYKSEKYKNDVYRETLKQIVEESLKDNVGLTAANEAQNAKDTTAPKPTEFGE